jgi:hypothetical protein
MNAVDRTFGWLLVICGLLHTIGPVEAYRSRPETLVWALSATLTILLLAALNLLRIGRPGDKTLAWISFAGCVGWLAIAIAFGAVIGNIMDLRVVGVGFITVVLAIFSIQSVRRVPGNPLP